MTIKAFSTAILFAVSPLAAHQALAHAGLQPAEAPAGKTYRATISIGHGCAGQATNTLRVILPEGLYNAKPMPKAGWTVETVTGPYAQPFDNHGTMMTEGPREIIWSGGALEDAWFDEFTLRGTIGKDIAPGTKLFLQTIQECADGKEEWTDTSGSHDVPNPAPFVTVTAAGGHGGHDAAAAQNATVTLGDLTMAHAYSRATPPAAPVAGGFVTITNSGAADDRLIDAASPVAGRMEIHEMSMQGEVMKMRKLPDGLPIPAGQSVELKPGGFHLMFLDLKQPMVEGETIPVTLTFEKAGEVEVPLTVGPRNAGPGMAMGQDDHGGH